MTLSGVFPRLCLALLIAGLFCAPASVFAQEPAMPVITSPTDGAYVQGAVEVKGTTDIPDFASAELAFAYNPDPTGAWFVIQNTGLPAADSVIATWDTTAITDGDYMLRLRVTLLDGSFRDAVVSVKVRNYMPIPTPSPAITPTQTAALLIPSPMIIVASDTPTAQPPTPVATLSALPPNPAAVAPAAVFSGFWKGALLVSLLVLAFGALLRLRR